MFVFLYFSLVIPLLHGAPYNCSNNYTPSNFSSFLRVPTNCQVDVLSNCPRSWKAGIPEGQATSGPLIYTEFITCHEGFTKCGYVPIDPKTGEVLGKSGVTFGAGVDLGSKSKNYSAFSSLPSYLIAKLEPYFGLRRNLAACAIMERPLNLSLEEATNITNAVKEYVANQVAERYDKDKVNNASNFVSLPRAIRTAVVSVWFQFGTPKGYPTFWGFVKKNDWKNAVKELRDFYTRPGKQQRGDLKRRNNEADIIEATLSKCDRSLDVVILLADSGSVSPESFRHSHLFIKNLVKVFQDEQLRGKENTRFGLSTFSSRCIDQFYLSSYTSQYEYLKAIADITQVGGGSFLGNALDHVRENQFTEKRGLRGEEHGVLRVLIVLTDEMSSDAVKRPAQGLHDKNVVVYAIGIGNYDFSQLQDVASSQSHVHTLSNAVKLDTFVATLTAATCSEPQPISLNKEVKLAAKTRSYQYFLFNVDTSRNLELTVDDSFGETFVYASRRNPHPYKYDNDISFDTAYRKDKIIVIPFKEKSTIQGNLTRVPIYISVTAKTANAWFSMKGTTCDPANCFEGTNQVQVIPLNKTVKSTARKDKYRYFIFNVDVNLNLEVTVYDLSGETLIYASRTNPQPNKTNDIRFDRAFKKKKVFVVSPKDPVLGKTATDREEMKSVYISVTANTDNAVFTIEGNTCNPSNCTESDTNIPVPSTATFAKDCFPLFISVTLTLSLFNLYCNFDFLLLFVF